MEARGRRLSYLLLLLVCGCAAVLLLDPGGSPRRHAITDSFQQQVGGLGFGPVLDLSGCAFGFDPRLEGACSAAAGPLPGGACFCPRHGGVLSYPPLRQGDLPRAPGAGRATPP